MGYLVVRIWNNEVFQNIEGVLEHVLNTATSAKTTRAYNSMEPPHPALSPLGRGFGQSFLTRLETSSEVVPKDELPERKALSPAGRGWGEGVPHASDSALAGGDRQLFKDHK